ncbi:two-component system, NtrC family, nitrogen regulation sensor histidine kinase NtrY [Albimonas pacifica]|uniref:histidine kinase n=2 Tax=Albimonas pacifica TaxID=1114924 RepID=A0A1I3K774_9RHOB|nr:PAS domain-containing sensor histidine kinase [Albimonas pacifica]SFI68371.1 two-component system, NtrC family, nitrogen regulation sensor histidine kinase NtrY [Albimonas pacifica]
MTQRTIRAARSAAEAVASLPSLALRGELSRRTRARFTLMIAALGPVLAVVTGVALSGGDRGPVRQEVLRGVFLLDLVYILVIAGLVAWRVAALISARRARSAGSRLHLRLTGVFAAMALAPTILVAVFATLTVSFGIEGWFSNQIGSVVRNSLEVAESYEEEHRLRIRAEALAMANDLAGEAARMIDDAQLGDMLRAQAYLREIPEAYIFDGSMELRARGEFSYLFNFTPPTPEQMARAREGQVVVISDESQSEVRALVALRGFVDYYLYVGRNVDGAVLRLLDETQDTVRLYEQLEGQRNSILLEFAMLYVGFALVVTMAAIWAGLYFAERLARPIGRLAGAAERVGAGDLDVRVREERGDDEIAVLARIFNRMTEQVKAQRDALVAVNQETERRRRFSSTVLAGVTAGVARLDAEGRVELLNEAGARMLGVTPAEAAGRPLAEVAPMFATLLQQARERRGGQTTERTHGRVDGTERDFLARVSRIAPEGDAEIFVLTFDDLTELVTAQRMAAWGDIARRIAHEIKNPLTPIQLSAERLKKKFSDGLVGRDRERFDSYADMIVRQAGDIRRMVDEFSRFARMPAPELAPDDLAGICSEAVLLQAEAGGPVAFSIEGAETPLPLRCDRTMLGQALTNLLKNAGEAVEARLAQHPQPPGRVVLQLRRDAETAEIRVIDNGVGLPETGRARLMEPYVTTREKGTGLGLAIVKKIAEEHGGAFALEDAPLDPSAPPDASRGGGAREGPRGAMAVIRLPLAGKAPVARPEQQTPAKPGAPETEAGGPRHG